MPSRSRRSVTKKRAGIGRSPLDGAPRKARSALLGKGRAAERTNFAVCGKVSDAELARTCGAARMDRSTAETYPWYTRGTRSETAQSSSYWMVPARSAASSTVTVSSPSLP